MIAPFTQALEAIGSGRPIEWVTAMQPVPVGLAASKLRRSTDIFISLFALIFAIPVMLMVAVLITLDSTGPIFYRQQRLGLNGASFTMLKLRSMRADAEATGPQWATINDPRITSIGRLLRRTHIDELPQFFNVLLGNMSVVGPRPERPHFAEHLTSVIPHYGARVSIKPGITGWAQVSLPYAASIEDARQKLSFDLYYIKHRSLLLDLRILLTTMGLMLNHRGAR